MLTIHYQLFCLGVAYPFSWKGAWLSANAAYRYTVFPKRSQDIQLNFFFGKGFWQYQILVAGSFVAWTENRNQGNDFTKTWHGKKGAFFGDPQVWFKVGRRLSVGPKFNTFYHVLTPANTVQIYPTLAMKQVF